MKRLPVWTWITIVLCAVWAIFFLVSRGSSALQFEGRIVTPMARGQYNVCMREHGNNQNYVSQCQLEADRIKEDGRVMVRERWFSAFSMGLIPPAIVLGIVWLILRRRSVAHT
jgi:hypothetical protein